MTTSRGYSDVARKRGVSRQAVQQAALVAAGLCPDCRQPRLANRRCCAACLRSRADQLAAKRAKKKP